VLRDSAWRLLAGTSLREEDGLRVQVAGSASEALERAGGADAGAGCLELLGALRALHPDIPVILTTGTKPFRLVIQASVARALEHRRLQEENRQPRRARGRADHRRHEQEPRALADRYVAEILALTAATRPMRRAFSASIGARSIRVALYDRAHRAARGPTLSSRQKPEGRVER
jgi:DNA-binding NtrC family response regulator